MKKEQPRKNKLLALAFEWIFRLCIAMPIGFVIGFVYGLLTKAKAPPADINEQGVTATTKASVASTETASDPSTKKEKFLSEFESCMDKSLTNGQTLRLKFYPLDGLITREMRRVDDVPNQRGNLAMASNRLDDYTKEFAVKEGLQFSLAAAYSYTLKNLGATEKVQVSMPAPKSTQKLGEGSIQVPQVEEPLETPIAEVEGFVTSMGAITVSRPGNKPYETFSVSLKTRLGTEKDFLGTHLKELAAKREFKLGDHILLKQFKRSSSSVDGKGKVKKVQQNFYTVSLLSMA